MESGIAVRIGSTTGTFDSREYQSPDRIEESWINQAIGHRRRDGLKVVLEVVIRTGAVDLRFRVPAGGSPGGGWSSPPNAQERAVMDLWSSLGLSRDDFTSGNVVAFFKQLRRLL